MDLPSPALCGSTLGPSPPCLAWLPPSCPLALRSLGHHLQEALLLCFSLSLPLSDCSEILALALVTSTPVFDPLLDDDPLQCTTRSENPLPWSPEPLCRVSNCSARQTLWRDPSTTCGGRGAQLSLASPLSPLTCHTVRTFRKPRTQIHCSWEGRPLRTGLSCSLADSALSAFKHLPPKDPAAPFSQHFRRRGWDVKRPLDLLLGVNWTLHPAQLGALSLLLRISNSLRGTSKISLENNNYE
ncbi:uncharacterized protein [Equus przewalskii]|uniref:Uncharacterized protein n=1 Tax=Equus przewalskii TaxID=9798 RepID=A0ABM4MA86_EQUPR